MQISTDKFGFRQSTYRMGEKKKILILGDSYTFVWGVDDDYTFPAYINKLKNDYPNFWDIEFVNLGISGWGTVHYKYALEFFIKHYGKDNIKGIIIYHCSNDIANNIRYFTNPRISREELSDVSTTDERIDSFLLKSDFINYLRIKGLFEFAKRKANTVFSDKSYKIHGIEFTNDFISSFDTGSTPGYNEKLERLFKILFSDILNTARKNDILVLNSAVDGFGEWENSLTNVVKNYPDIAVYYSDKEVFYDLSHSNSKFNKRYINDHSGGHYSPIGNEKLARFFLNKLSKLYYSKETSIDLVPDLKSPQDILTTITWTCKLQDSKMPAYEFWLKREGQRYNKVQDSSSNIYRWKPRGGGKYSLRVRVKDDDQSRYIASREYQDYEIHPVISSLAPSVQSPQEIGNRVNWTAVVSGKRNRYEFLIERNNGGLKSVQGPDVNPVFNWIPHMGGRYNIRVRVKDVASAEWDGYLDINTFIVNPQIQSLSISKPQNANVGDEIEIKTHTSGGKDNMYEFWAEKFLDDRQIGFNKISNWQAENRLTWIPKRGGIYNFRVRVRSKNSKADYDDQMDKNVRYLVDDPKPQIVKLEIDKPSPGKVDDIVRIKTHTFGGKKNHFQFWVETWINENSSGWKQFSNWQDSGTF